MKEFPKKELVSLTREIVSGKLASTIAHKAKNILMPLTGYAELIQGGVSEEKQEEYFKKISSCGQNLQLLLKRFLRFSRSPEEKVYETIDIPELVEEIISLFDHYMVKTKIRLEKNISMGVEKVRGIYDDISLIIASLLLNAIETRPQGAAIRLVVEGVHPVRNVMHAKAPHTSSLRGTQDEISNWVNISIDDDGPGVSEEIKDKIFEPFFTTKTGSLGIGLTASLFLAKGMSGDLTIEGKNRFILSLCQKR